MPRTQPGDRQGLFQQRRGQGVTCTLSTLTRRPLSSLWNLGEEASLRCHFTVLGKRCAVCGKHSLRSNILLKSTMSREGSGGLPWEQILDGYVEFRGIVRYTRSSPALGLGATGVFVLCPRPRNAANQVVGRPAVPEPSLGLRSQSLVAREAATPSEELAVAHWRGPSPSAAAYTVGSIVRWLARCHCLRFASDPAAPQICSKESLLSPPP